MLYNGWPALRPSSYMFQSGTGSIDEQFELSPGIHSVRLTYRPMTKRKYRYRARVTKVVAGTAAAGFHARRFLSDHELARYGLVSSTSVAHDGSCYCHANPLDAEDVSLLEASNLEDLMSGLDFDAPLHERMEPHGAVCVHVADDGLEAHYAVPIVRNHTSARDFTFVGLRRVPCSGGEKHLAGWCSAARHCKENSFRRDILPGMDQSGTDRERVALCIGHNCECSDRVYKSLGEFGLMATLQRGACTIDNEDLAGRDAHRFTAEGHDYMAVNPGKPHQGFFSQWGVVKVLSDGSYHCRTCSNTPRHCAHIAHVMGIETEDGTRLYNGGVSPSTTVDRNIRKSLTKEGPDARPAIDCVSREMLPFFPDEDPTVHRHWKGEGLEDVRLLLIVKHVLTCAFHVVAYKDFKYKVPKEIKPLGTWPSECPGCGCGGPPVTQVYDMEVFSSQRMDHTKFIVQSCAQCDFVRHADGKEYGLLIVHYKVG